MTRRPGTPRVGQSGIGVKAVFAGMASARSQLNADAQGGLSLRRGDLEDLLYLDDGPIQATHGQVLPFGQE